MSTQFMFDKDYSEYWERVSGDKSQANEIPNLSVFGNILAGLLGSRFRTPGTALDVACGSGRLFEPIRRWALAVDGIDIEKTATRKAMTKGYRKVHCLDAKDLEGESKYDLIVCWAAFEVLDQFEALRAFSRVCNREGLVVISGKNSNYLADDDLAIDAEKGAQAKGFRQSFIEPEGFTAACKSLGFAIEETLVFDRRGDIAKESYSKHIGSFPTREFYEFVVLLRKCEPPNPTNYLSTNWSHPQSQTMSKLLARNV